MLQALSRVAMLVRRARVLRVFIGGSFFAFGIGT